MISYFRTCLILIVIILITENSLSFAKQRKHALRHSRFRRQRNNVQATPTKIPKNSTFTIEGLDGELEESGPWGPWVNKSECSRSCGGGVLYFTRTCSNRERCAGPTKKFESCNTQVCPEGTPDFRSSQCARFNTLPFEEKYYSWIPYNKAPNKCELNCMPRLERFYFRHSRKVIDGTPCYDDGRLNVCVDGICLPVGCDRVLGSTSKEDKCRKCAGDGTSCKTVNGTFDLDNLRTGYNDILLIPAGATNIHVKELGPTSNYLAVRNVTGNYYLNGYWKIDFPRDKKFAGALFQYERKPHGFKAPESLRALGPTNEAIFIVLLYQESNPGVHYEYSVPEDVAATHQESYTWVYDDFSECSTTCGGGFQTRSVGCKNSISKETVPDYLCDLLLQPAINRSCSNQPCPASFSVGEWSECSQACGTGVQFRNVFCQQIQYGGVYSLVDESECFLNGLDKPEQMQPCENNSTCPEWVVGQWSTCNTLCGPGEQTRQVTCETLTTDNVTNTVNDEHCDASKRPASNNTCMNTPCEGIDWVATEWSGCNACGLYVESRFVRCTNVDGEMFDEEMCDISRKLETERECNSTVICNYRWFASEWSQCSVSCGAGMETRDVICGNYMNGTIEQADDSECNDSLKYSNSQECNTKDCDSMWFSGPWTKCSASCGGGNRDRKVICVSDESSNNTDCDTNSIPENMDSCNIFSCDGDEMMVMDGCKNSDHGCCPDGMTSATGPNSEGCPDDKDATPCNEAEFGCCSDAVTAAFGPFREGCPNYTNCNGTMFGCCLEGILAAKGEDFEGCPITNCTESYFGCCPDGIRFALDSDLSGCENVTSCNETEFGCCLDGISAALGANFTGCDCNSTDDCMILSEDGLHNMTNITECSNTTFGCCPDNLTSAIDANMTNCMNISDCVLSDYGCCPDGVTADLDGNFTNCPNFTDCNNTTFGCCPDNLTIAVDGNFTNCFNMSDCDNSTFGCCPDGFTTAMNENFTNCAENCNSTEFGCCPDDVTVADGPDFFGCLEGSADLCSESEHGCCPDGFTVAGPNNTGCDNVTALNCSETMFGCCPNSSLAALDENFAGCENVTINCENSTFGCCEDNSTIALGPDYLGCPGPCINSTYGCCPDNVTSVLGPYEEGCYPDCYNSTFGCCPDNMTFASEMDFEGCENVTIDCENSTFGCCPDNVTVAIGPYFEGCENVTIECENSTFGCCPDNVTIAIGPYFEGCENVTIECENSTFGCCLDNFTVATGPDFEGCLESCENSTYGCCADNATLAQGPDMDGCENITNCSEAEFGCCPGNITAATGPDFESCPCELFEYGCCPDGIYHALGPRFLGCTCHYLEHGCCQDGYTPAKGANFTGCSCDVVLFSCCPDNLTPARGPHYEGCGCETMHFGCCADGVTVARGENLYGCGCDTTQYGCCYDNVTPARGANYGGCDCRASPHGCCQDDRTAAQGPSYQGCDCYSSRYGCCRDRTTPASGPNYEGCGCYTTEFGCCPDGQTQASGPNYGGCDCRTTAFGCCPDNVTYARGSNYQGCDCRIMPHGCCPDGRTTSPGPNYEGCPCETGLHGCCEDGIRMAEGPNQEGCAARPTKSGVVCGLDWDRGTCRDYKIYWFFDMKYGGCGRFWYGGCGGNENRFESQEECKQTCIKPSGKDACKLPLVKGTCDAALSVWGYSHKSNKCVKFTYGGCIGNNNRFNNKYECENTCIEDSPAVDVCDQPRDSGPCDNRVSRFYFNKDSKICQQFAYGGCEGNSNNFETLEQCQGACNAVTTAPSQDRCFLSRDVGTCIDFQERWYFDSIENRCELFIYGGCQGNTNNFLTIESCEASCIEFVATPTPANFLTEYCFLDYEIGPCTDSTIFWYYDYKTGICDRFYFGGCDGNQNRFRSRVECEQKCGNTQDLCELPVTVGVCSGQFMQWYYDLATDSCMEFFYTGCQGNKNRFNSLEKCEDRCQKRTTEPSTATTELPSTYSPSTNATEVSSVLTTLPTITTTPRLTIEEICGLPEDKGSCSLEYEQYFFSTKTGKCEILRYSGCGGNANRFATIKNCRLYCEKETTGNETEVVNNNVCRLPAEAGPCTDEIDRWYFDINDTTCKQFVYGGCDGNKNRFKSYELCIRFCSDVSPTVCSNGKDTCTDIRCPYGVEETVDIHGCRNCRCFNPCRGVACQRAERCVIEVERGVDGEIITTPICRLDNKPGTCPVIENAEDAACRRQCNTDADCRSDRKCCSVGCSMLCQDPEGTDVATTPETTTVTDGAIPTVEIVNIDNTIEVGETLLLQCEAGGEPTPLIVWFKDQEQIENGPRIMFDQSGSLRIIRVEQSDASLYTCLAYNKFGQNRAEIQVSVYGDVVKTTAAPTTESPANTTEIDGEGAAPTIEPTDKEITAKLKSPVALRCKASGNPKPNIVWYKGNEILNSDDGRYMVLVTGILQIPSVERQDADIYRCLAYNNYGRDDIAIRLNVEENVNVEIIQSDPPYYVGSTVQLNCNVTGFPKPRFGWYFNSKPIRPATDILMFANGTLILQNITTNHTGIYQCLGANQVSQKSSYVDIMVKSEEEEFPDCTDSPHFADCQRIVDGDFCNNVYYSRYCCRSCYEAGKLDPSILKLNS